MNSEFKEYVLAEIPALKSCKSYKFPIMLWRVRRFQPSYDAVVIKDTEEGGVYVGIPARRVK